MKLELFNSEANKIWKKAAGASSVKSLNLELDLYKKLLSFFQAGDYYYYIFNLLTYDFDFVSKEIEAVLGYAPSELSVQFLMDKIHPDDRPWFLNFERKAVEFLGQLPPEKLTKYKRRYDYRLRKKNGEYLRILHQTIVIEYDENGRLLRTLGVHTDINDLKPAGKPVLSFIGLEGEPSYINVDVEKLFAVSKETLTKREKQILGLLIDGRLSKEVAGILNISKQTVDRHRKNMLHKNKLSNIGELVAKAIRQGWL